MGGLNTANKTHYNISVCFVGPPPNLPLTNHRNFCVAGSTHTVCATNGTGNAGQQTEDPARPTAPTRTNGDSFIIDSNAFIITAS